MTAPNQTADPAAARAALDGLTQQSLGLSLPELLDAGPEQAGQRAQTRLRHAETLRQTHLESVLRRAADALEQAGKGESVEPGWLMRYVDGASAAASELEQSVWAGLLAAEIAEPGTISRRTLAFMRDMDAWELASFAKYCAFAFTFESGWRFVFAEEAALREIWVYERDVEQTAHWVRIGLLASKVETLEPGKLRGLKIGYHGREWELASPASAEASACVYRKFTAIGQQIAGAMTVKPWTGFARSIVKLLNTRHGMGWSAVAEPEPATAPESAATPNLGLWG
jgi:hypothetical protein